MLAARLVRVFVAVPALPPPFPQRPPPTQGAVAGLGSPDKDEQQRNEPEWFSVLKNDWNNAQQSYAFEVTTIAKRETDKRVESERMFDVVGQGIKHRVVGTRLFSTYISAVIIIVGVTTGADLSIEVQNQAW